MILVNSACFPMFCHWAIAPHKDLHEIHREKWRTRRESKTSARSRESDWLPSLFFFSRHGEIRSLFGWARSGCPTTRPSRHACGFLVCANACAIRQWSGSRARSAATSSGRVWRPTRRSCFRQTNAPSRSAPTPEKYHQAINPQWVWVGGDYFFLYYAGR